MGVKFGYQAIFRAILIFSRQICHHLVVRPDASADGFGIIHVLQYIGPRRGAGGVFGVPSFILDGELFRGTDTFAQIRQRLAGRIA